MKPVELPEAFRRLRRAAKHWMLPVIDEMRRRGESPYRILIASLLSARTLDKTTMVVAPQLFERADTPDTMLQLSEDEIERLIHRVTYSRAKAGQILRLSRILLDQYGGQVPDDIEALDELPGVGRKIANLVVTQAFGRPGICVDTHVHRITNRWGTVQSKTPDETEMILREKLPRRHWIEINPLLVALGQNICLPTSPKCSVCPVREFCDRVGVTRSR